MTQRVGLWWVFGLVGAVGGWLTALAWGPKPTHDLGFVALLTISTAVWSAFVGAASERLVRHNRIGAIGICVIAAGAMNGACLALIIIGKAVALLFGGILGVVHAIVFVPPMTLIAAAAYRVDVARDVSVIGKARRRRVFRVAGTSVAVAVAVASVLFSFQLDPVAIAAGIAACATAFLCAAYDIRAHHRVKRQLTTWIRATPCDERGSDSFPTTDYGVGDAWRILYSPATNAYRSAGEPAELFHGDADVAHGELVAFRNRSLASVAGAVAALVVLIQPMFAVWFA